jgi:hypothetical protein
MQSIEKIPLVASEIAGVWNAYHGDSSAICMLRHFLNHVDDEGTRTILQHTLNLSEQHIECIKGILNQESLPIPHGFKEEDVDINAPRLFTDSYYLLYLSHMSGFGMESYALILRYIARSDIRDYFTKCLFESIDLFNKVTDLQLSKGIYLRVPRVDMSKEVSFISDKSFFEGLFAANPRPVLAREITSLFSGISFDILFRVSTLGFAQVSKLYEVQEYMLKGKNLAVKHMKGFSSKLNKEDIPAPSVSESFITDSTISPFSDKLMMFGVLEFCNSALVVDSAAISSSLRYDIATLHLGYSVEFAKYTKDGMNIMINNGWMEQPPQSIDHEALSEAGGRV